MQRKSPAGKPLKDNFANLWKEPAGGDPDHAKLVWCCLFLGLKGCGPLWKAMDHCSSSSTTAPTGDHIALVNKIREHAADIMGNAVDLPASGRLGGVPGYARKMLFSTATRDKINIGTATSVGTDQFATKVRNSKAVTDAYEAAYGHDPEAVLLLVSWREWGDALHASSQPRARTLNPLVTARDIPGMLDDATVREALDSRSGRPAATIHGLLAGVAVPPGPRVFVGEMRPARADPKKSPVDGVRVSVSTTPIVGEPPIATFGSVLEDAGNELVEASGEGSSLRAHVAAALDAKNAAEDALAAKQRELELKAGELTSAKNWVSKLASECHEMETTVAGTLTTEAREAHDAYVYALAQAEAEEQTFVQAEEPCAQAGGGALDKLAMAIEEKIRKSSNLMVACITPERLVDVLKRKGITHVSVDKAHKKGRSAQDIVATLDDELEDEEKKVVGDALRTLMRSPH